MASPSWYKRLYGAEWEAVRQRILVRDGYRCVECGMTREEHRQRFGTDLHVHHIQTLKAEMGLNFDWNLVTLCEGCHKAKHPFMKRVI